MSDQKVSRAAHNRVVFLDYLRVLSCYSVILIHSTEFYYIGQDGKSVVRSKDTSLWVSLINSFVRSSVPIFVMISAYLMLPLNVPADVFFKRRFIRVVVPLLVWLLFYAVLPYALGQIGAGELMDNLRLFPICFAPSAAHLWYVYMIVGIYMFMPVLSPWLSQTTRRGEEAFLAVWLLTTFWHYISVFYPNGMLGAAFWNEFHMLHNFSGYIGYIVLGHYIRTHIHWSRLKSLIIGTPLFLIGYVITASVFYYNHWHTDDIYALEVPWRYCTFNIAMMAFGVMVICKCINWPTGALYRLVQGISRLSYGVYLMHICFLPHIHAVVSKMLPVPWSIFLVAVSTFAVSTLVTAILYLLPFSQYVLG